MQKKKKNQDQYLAILTEQAQSIKDLLHDLQDTIFLRDTAGNLERARGPNQVANHSARFCLFCPVTKLQQVQTLVQINIYRQIPMVASESQKSSRISFRWCHTIESQSNNSKRSPPSTLTTTKQVRTLHWLGQYENKQHKGRKILLYSLSLNLTPTQLTPQESAQQSTVLSVIYRHSQPPNIQKQNRSSNNCFKTARKIKCMVTKWH